MSNHFNSPPRHFSVETITSTIERALDAAGLDTRSGPMLGITETIRRALSSHGAASSAKSAVVDPTIIEAVARVLDPPNVEPQRPNRPPDSNRRTAPGEFLARQFHNHVGTRTYKLYVPAQRPEAPLPLIVMLHGCTQSADDFSAGTQMNRLAEEHGFLVVYPEQAHNANPSKCWNWFKAQDQARENGEPSLIAGIVHEVASNHPVDRRRIFVAGLSAGAAMAVILGETYPELFAGVGAHSGLPFGSAHDIPSALAAMKGGKGRAAGLTGLTTSAAVPRKLTQAVPTIVFHGDRDHTVQPSNGAAIVEQAKDAHGSVLSPSTQRATTPGGRSYSRTVHADSNGRPHLESWTVHGAGHAWSGGHPSGSYTDSTGPDASAEMIRFFLAQPRAGSA
jgi:poly(hydroxyalkanoate) depolymerase family esterase